jgi:ribonuclease P/MRP protein subunit POP1
MHYPQSQFGGLIEYSQISFERGVRAFPDDWPGTIAGDKCGKKVADELKEKWDRRPNGKKESWGKILKGLERKEVGDPFNCDWTLLSKKHDEEQDKLKMNEMEKSIETIREQAKAAMEGSVEVTLSDPIPFLLSPEYSKQLFSRKIMVTTVDLSTALIPIQFRFLQKGNVSFRARIYRLPISQEDRQPWIDLLSKDKQKSSKENSETKHPRSPGEDDLLGFVTTGNVSLSIGRGKAIGALSWNKAISEEERWLDKKELRRVCIVRDVGTDIGRLARWEIAD